MNSTGPTISVVIPTRSRETRLRFALEALAAQTLDRDRFEVIVARADDGDPGHGDPPKDLELRTLQGPAGPAAQRNQGWRAARGELIAFTDDDCRPDPCWLERLAAAADGSPATILQGRTEPDPDEDHLLHGRARSIEILDLDGWYPTCNIAYPRELLERLGGFDEDFPTSWGEDTDLGFRAAAEGAEVRFVADAVVHHAVHARTIGDAVAEALRRDSIPMVIARHPESRRHLYLGVFVRRTHASFLLAVAGLLFARRAPLISLLAALPYLGARRRLTATTLPKALAHLPANAIVDGAEVFAVGRAAIRHRVLVL